MPFLKKSVAKTPAFIGVRAASLPFRYRLGSVYDEYFKTIELFERASVDERRELALSGVRSLVEHAATHIEFYTKFYRDKGFEVSSLKHFEDIERIPIISKTDLQAYSLNDRSASTGGMVANTGGTSGQPLDFMLDGEAYAREWSHMHTIWKQLNYKTSSIKITLRGMNLGRQPVKYNFIHNEFQINAYCEFGLVVKALSGILAKYRVEYLHGYPSGIYEFVKQLAISFPAVLQGLKLNLKGVFFGSEFPAPIYRDYIESILGVETVSWYGHSEMAILAREKDTPFVYYPFQSYGFTEAVKVDGKHHLVGTTIHNRVGPLIRYDTEDIIEPVSFNAGVLESFRISEGRLGEFVVDANGRNISLTALIFGRHHELFASADFIQVKQASPGELTVYVTTQNKNLDCEGSFDSEGMNMAIDFEIVNSPFKTAAGKVPLIVK